MFLGVQGIIVVYDISMLQSFNQLIKWINYVQIVSALFDSHYLFCKFTSICFVFEMVCKVGLRRISGQHFPGSQLIMRMWEVLGGFKDHTSCSI